MPALSVDGHVAALVRAAPPLTPGQVRLLTSLLHPAVSDERGSRPARVGRGSAP